MKNERDSIVFQTKLGNIKDALNMLLDKGIITANTYIDFLIRVLEIETMEELNNLIADVANICKTRGLN